MEEDAFPIPETLDVGAASSSYDVNSEEQESEFNWDSANYSFEYEHDEQESEFVWAESDSDDFDPLKTMQPQESAPHEEQPSPDYISGLEIYFSLSIGKLPSADVCYASGNSDLAQVPIRETSRIAVQYHFFANDIAVTPNASEGIYNELVCQFENCSFRCSSSHGIQPLFGHITETHKPSLDAVIAFRKAQRDQLYA